ncbi:GAD-like domain-containing protein [Pseudomonas sp. 22-AL-CL-001]|uniref:GAD-like domain-containing protein n=1 Tax=Pseudomonas alabamensis TaxID=3064349 RepID=UPI0027142082|nr:GAD-like domain-containing protein [Pseudomonas sp. 22-AL-CL-001]MDO7911137.1 GAD-like domain-containing protein [Pseudomonas sp. 22-AL-CL-001]
MDDVIRLFFEEMGTPIAQEAVPTSSIVRYSKILPERLLNYWQDYGWSGHADGIFWIVDPQEYEGVVSAWLKDTVFETRDTYHVIARTAFGKLYLWGEKTGQSLTIESCYSLYAYKKPGTTTEDLDRQCLSFFLSASFEFSDFLDLFDPAKRKLGILQSDEIYGFVPALMIGGSEDLKNLEKLKIIEHLTFLAQLAPLEPYTLANLYP